MNKIFILTIAMSCLAAGFSTGVTSFNFVESAVLMAERSSELGLVSDILEMAIM